MRCYHIVVIWDGSKRAEEASVGATGSADTFNVEKGVFVQQNPGGGNWHEVTAFKSLSYDDSEFSMKMEICGGQNYSIWIPSKNENNVTVSVSGPYRIGYRGYVDAPLDVSEIKTIAGE